MTQIVTDSYGSYKRTPYVPRGAVEQLFYSSDRRVLLEGPSRCGKSRGVLEKIKGCALRWPNSRHLIVRKTRASLTESILQTMEDFVLPRSLISGNAGRANRLKYDFPNNSEIVIGGMDNAERILSSEYDTIYYAEAIESTSTDAQTLYTRLFNGKMPFQQIIFDCNPGPPNHHLNVAANEGLLRRFKSTHKDNPRLYNEDGTQTKGGKEYLDDLKRLTGVSYHRYYLANWVAAEGLVYEDYDPEIHMIDKHDTPYSHFIAGVDWGIVDPGVFQVWGIDLKGRSVLEYECYRHDEDIDYWKKIALRVQQKYRPKRWICDSARPDNMRQLSKIGIPVMKAQKDIFHGIQVTQARFALQKDGRPAIYIKRDSREKVDKELKKKGKPTSLSEELWLYAYPEEGSRITRREVPLDDNNHSCDTLRYIQVYLDKFSKLDITKKPS